jgi:hypothetical protein
MSRAETQRTQEGESMKNWIKCVHDVTIEPFGVLGFLSENTLKAREGELNPMKMTLAIFATPREVKKCVDTIGFD